MRTFTIPRATLGVLGVLGLALSACGNLSESGPISVAYTPDGRLVTFLAGEVRISDRDGQHVSRKIATRAQLDGWMPFSPRLVMSRNGARAAIAVNREVDVFDLAAGAKVATFLVEPDPAVTSSIAGLALSPTGDELAVSVRPIGTGTPHLDVWRVADGTRLVTIAPTTPTVGTPVFDNVRSSWDAGLAFSLDASVLYGVESVRADDGQSFKQLLTAWNVADGAQVWRSELPPELDHGLSEGVRSYFTSLALSPDGATLATGSNEVVLWRAVDGARVGGYQTPQTDTPAQAIAIAPDGRSVATTYATNQVDQNAFVFGPTGAIAFKWPVEPRGAGCEGLAFSPDGERLAAACSTNQVRIWNPTTGEVVATVSASTTLY